MCVQNIQKPGRVVPAHEHLPNDKLIPEQLPNWSSCLKSKMQNFLLQI